MAVLYFFLLLILLILLKRYFSQTHDQMGDAKLPPGPSQLPVIGSMHHLLVGSPIRHRRLLELANKYGPLMHLRIGEIHTIVVSSPEVAKEMLKTHDQAFAERPVFSGVRVLLYERKDVAFSPYGAYWRQMRKICVLELLSARRVRSFRSIREDAASDLVRKIYDSATGHSPAVIDIREKVLSFTTNVISRAALGRRKSTDKEAIVPLLREASLLVLSTKLHDFFPSNRFLGLLSGSNGEIRRVHREIDRLLDRIIDNHKGRKLSNNSNLNEEEEDFVDVLLRLQAESDLEFPLTRDHIKATIFDMYAGGIDTSAVTLEWALSELMRNPESMQRAQAEVREALGGKETVGEGDIQGLHYLRLVIKETLRMHPPGPLLIGRQCRETCTIGGYTIPEQSLVLVNAWALGRDPRYWDDPESFRPERFDSNPKDYKGTIMEYIPFGTGRRMCPGVQFAMASVELPLAMLLYHYDWKLPDGMKPEYLDMTEDSLTGSMRKFNLCLIAIPRISLSLSSKF